MAQKKGVGSSRNGRDSNPKYLGVKMYGGQAIDAGNIIVRQRGTEFHPGPGVGLGRERIFTVLTLGFALYQELGVGRERRLRELLFQLALALGRNLRRGQFQGKIYAPAARQLVESLGPGQNGQGRYRYGEYYRG